MNDTVAEGTEDAKQETICLDESEFDPSFREEILKTPGGENLKYCFQCNTCTAVCPVSAKNEEYSPRRIIMMALLGLRGRVLASKQLWLCSTCYNCFVRCPQDVKITSLLRAIQNIASREGKIHKSYKTALERLEKTGRTVELSEFENMQREKLDCPPISDNPENSKKIIEKTKVFDKISDSED
jgi:heterodisulfide reductase subunit C